ncbi:MAG: response regulator [Myxococcaceae bacterium]|nr:response regulator [Myxococcaceae bacterium]
MFDRTCDVVTAGNGTEALQVLRTRRVDLLITDQRMPEMTGTQLIAQARTEGIDVTAILLTAYSSPQDLIAAINQGHVYRFVSKPWDINDLSLTVKNALEVVSLRKEKERLLVTLRKRLEALSVLYEFSRGGEKDVNSTEGIVDRLLAVVGRVLPHDVSAVLVQSHEGSTASLRIRCHGTVSEKALLNVKESLLAAYRKTAGVVLPEDKVLARVTGDTTAEASAPSHFPGSVVVPLVAGQQVVGTLGIFSSDAEAYSTEDGELLDLLINQTTDAISHLRAAETDSRRRIEQMVEAMSDGVVLTDEKNEVVVINPAAKKLLDLADGPGHVTMRGLEDKLGFAPFEMVRGWEYSGQKIYREELKIGDRHLHLTVSPVVEAAGALRGVLIALRDVSEQRRLEERKDEFVSMVSHELRTPLTSVTGALDLVLNHITGDINDRQRRYLEMARDSTDRLNAMVDDLLDLSKFAKGRMRMSFEITHLDELAKACVEKYGAAFAEKRLTVSLGTRGDGLKVLVDPNRLMQVFNNLLTNAVKFTPAGGQVTVDLKAAEGLPGFVAISVWNSGEPIAEADLERIFDRFEQARSPRTKNVAGTGLGLSICRSIVEGHGGRVWAEPCTDGARFVVVLPVQPTPEALAPQEREQDPAAAQRPSRGTVLVVEDQVELAWVMKATLLQRGYQVVLAASGEEALALARRVRPEIITLDIELPDMNGLELSEIFRHDPDTRNARVLVISGHDEREKALRAGASGYLKKPIEGQKLIAAVEGFASAPALRGRVLVVDDDPQICAICVEVLGNLGFDAVSAKDVATARRSVADVRPDLLLLDVMLPDGDGFSFFEELKAERASSPLPVVFVSARSETSAKVRALKLGGDDYLTKPFDALELGARVESVLRRRQAEASASPTTRLPGPSSIEREVQRRLSLKAPFAFAYLDLDNLKAYNDYYGFAKADGVVRQTGDLLREIFARDGQPGDFLGHVAGDDFVFITAPQTVDVICRKVIEAFDRIIPLYYDKADRERGYIEAEDRFGERRKFPIMSVSVVAVLADGRSADHAELARLAADMKKRAKAVTGSVYLRSDRPGPVKAESA